MKKIKFISKLVFSLLLILVLLLEVPLDASARRGRGSRKKTKARPPMEMRVKTPRTAQQSTATPTHPVQPMELSASTDKGAKKGKNDAKNKKVQTGTKSLALFLSFGGHSSKIMTSQSENYSAITGVMVGFGLDYFMAPKFSIGLGINYFNSAGGSIDQVDDRAGVEVYQRGAQRLNYLRIPIMLKAYSDSGLNFGVGPDIGILLGATRDVFAYADGNYVELSEIGERKKNKDDFNSTDFGLRLQLGYDWEFSDSMALRLNIGSIFGFVDIRKDADNQRNFTIFFESQLCYFSLN